MRLIIKQSGINISRYYDDVFYDVKEYDNNKTKYHNKIYVLVISNII